MSSSYSNTETSTYTVADVEKVVRSIKADLMMIADSTKAITEDRAKDYAHDIELLAKKNYLKTVDVTLLSSNGEEIKAAKYQFQNEGASGSERPGGVLWPATPSGRIRIILSYTDAYRAQPDQVSKMPMKISWVPTSDNTNHNSLSPSGSRGYSSNGFGANRNDFS
ncbi:hypothetical protein I5R28_12265 [Serratia marcescens]|uniref:HORMA-1 domain-containing protein n=1 Tax=Hafnia paralvei TaxID=546367 RepID=UPI0018D894B4|nr:hypothetical protein [Hafnia paralvei]MBH3170691.1 hypothetical protein [Serratia marcescens]